MFGFLGKTIMNIGQKKLQLVKLTFRSFLVRVYGYINTITDPVMIRGSL